MAASAMFTDDDMKGVKKPLSIATMTAARRNDGSIEGGLGGTIRN
jgi:hypothetical protein